LTLFHCLQVSVSNKSKKAKRDAMLATATSFDDDSDGASPDARRDAMLGDYSSFETGGASPKTCGRQGLRSLSDKLSYI
jgi:hypothetical protein